MIFAQIKDNVVENCIVLDDLSLESLFAEGFDAFIRIDEMDPRPGVGYSYVDGIFTPPEEG